MELLMDPETQRLIDLLRASIRMLGLSNRASFQPHGAIREVVYTFVKRGDGGLR
jgi:hypothetical protein